MIKDYIGRTNFDVKFSQYHDKIRDEYESDLIEQFHNVTTPITREEPVNPVYDKLITQITVGDGLDLFQRLMFKPDIISLPIKTDWVI